MTLDYTNPGTTIKGNIDVKYGDVRIGHTGYPQRLYVNCVEIVPAEPLNLTGNKTLSSVVGTKTTLGNESSTAAALEVLGKSTLAALTTI